MFKYFWISVVIILFVILVIATAIILRDYIIDEGITEFSFDVIEDFLDELACFHEIIFGCWLAIFFLLCITLFLAVIISFLMFIIPEGALDVLFI